MPPPVPPSVNAGRMIAGRPMSASAASAEAWRASSSGPSTMNNGVRLVDPVEQVAERLAVLGHPDGLEGRAQQAHVVPLEDAGLGQRGGEVEGRLAAEAHQQALRLLAGDMTASMASTVSGSR